MYRRKNVLGFLRRVLGGLLGGWILGYFGSVIVCCFAIVLAIIVGLLMTAVCTIVTFGHYIPAFLYAAGGALGALGEDQFFTFCFYVGNVVAIASAGLAGTMYLIWGPGALGRYLEETDPIAQPQAG
jgi:hypothetical protein